MIFSRILFKLDKFQIQITWTILNFSGCTPVLRHMLYILLKGAHNVKLIIFSISVGTPFGPVPLYLFNSLISRKTSLGVLGSKAKEFGFDSGRYWSKDFKIGVLFFSRILSATVEK